MKAKEAYHKYYSPYWFFTLFCLISILQSFLVNKFVITDDIFYKSYAERYSYKRILEISNIISKVTWIGYVLTPFWYFIKFSIVAMVLATGDFLFDYKIGFRKLLQE